MELSTIQALTRLNQRFYAEHGENFAESRPRLAAGVTRVLAGIPAGARVLEVGCGDGKVGRALARAGVGAYVGLDASEAMLERAKRYSTAAQDTSKATVGIGPSAVRPALRSVVFLSADLTDPDWPAAIGTQAFDWALAFAVFHHLPGYALRLGVLRALAARLAPGGRVALSNWQFTRSARALKRIVPWAQAGLSESDVEPGDYLLTWERKGRHGLRYLHLLNGQEMQRMTAEAGLSMVETFSADGVTGDLSEYVVAQGQQQ